MDESSLQFETLPPAAMTDTFKVLNGQCLLDIKTGILASLG